MVSLGIWYLGLALEFLLLLRALNRGFLKKYAFFYLYVAWVFSLSLVRLVVYLNDPALYRPIYWYTQPVSVLAGCAVLWEIYRKGLGRYPGAARMARNLLLFSIVMVFSKLIVNFWNTSVWLEVGTTADLERNMRAVQAVFLVVLLLVLAHYSVPLGKNVKGMILGYGFFVSTSLVNLTFRIFLGTSFQQWWQYLQPVFYLTVLIIWCVTLWSFQAVPVAEIEPKIEEDYQLLAARSRRRLLQLRTYLVRAIRS